MTSPTAAACSGAHCTSRCEAEHDQIRSDLWTAFRSSCRSAAPRARRADLGAAFFHANPPRPAIAASAPRSAFPSESGEISRTIRKFELFLKTGLGADLSPRATITRRSRSNPLACCNVTQVHGPPGSPESKMKFQQISINFYLLASYNGALACIRNLRLKHRSRRKISRETRDCATG